MIAFATALILLGIAGLHAAWGLGITWPDRDSQALARRVAGFKGIRKAPPPAACFAVAVVLAIGAMLIADLAPIPSGLRLLALILMALIFAARGALAYNRHWRAMTPEEPFATLDRRYYGPLCLAIAFGIAVTLVQDFGTT